MFPVGSIWARQALQLGMELGWMHVYTFTGYGQCFITTTLLYHDGIWATFPLLGQLMTYGR